MTTTQFVNAVIYTGDPAHPWGTSLAVRDGTIAAVDAPVEGPSRQVDLGGAFLMPGFVDCHNHHALAGFADLFEFTVRPDADQAELLATVAEHARRDSPGHTGPSGWLVGNGWSPLLFGELTGSTPLQALDDITGDRPTILRDQSWHNRWVNTAALEAGGLAGNPGIVPGGGLLIEGAGLAVERALSRARATSGDAWRRASARGIEKLQRYGVTAFQDAAASLPLMRALQHLDADGELAAWVVSCAVVNDPFMGIEPTGRDLIAQSRATASRHHRPTFAKLFLDGIPPARTSALLEPYLPDGVRPADDRGELSMPIEELTATLLELSSAGLSAKVHATGDAAVRATLDAVEACRRAGHTENLYHVAHGQYVHPADIPRFAELGVVAEISPFVWWPGLIPQALASVLPPDRAGRIHPNHDLLHNDALISAGSDWPVSESPDPLQAIYGLVTRTDPSGQFPGRLWPEQAISLEQAIAVFTRNGALATGLDDVTGVLRTGLSADFVVLDANPLREDITRLPRRNVVETWFAGNRVYQR